jgi:hypothetical protein
MSKRKFCWLYYDTAANQVVQVKKPHRKSVNPQMVVYSRDSEGNLQDLFSIPLRQFFTRFVYLGGMNHGKV